VVGLTVFSINITEQKRAEEALRQSEEKFRTLIENADDNIARYDRDARLIYLNPKLEAFLAATSGKRYGKTPTEEPPDGTYIATGEPGTCDLTFPDGAGGKQYHFVKMVAERNTRGEIVGVLAIGRDITERKQAEEQIIELTATLEHRVVERTTELQQALAFNEGIINALPDMLFEMDGKGTYLNVWTKDETLLRERKRELLGHTAREVLPQKAADTLLFALDQADHIGVSFGRVLRLQLPQGRRWFELSVSRKGDGHFLVISRDVTERIRQQDLLREKEQEFRTLAENSPDNIARYDTQCRVSYLNPSFCRALGLTESPVGKSASEIHQQQTEYLKKIAQVLESGEEAEINLTRLNAVERERYYHVRFVAERGPDGEIRGVLAIGRDITENKRVEQELYEKQQRLNDLALELALSEQRERRRIASDLHDHLGQDLVLTKIKIGSLDKTELAEKQKNLLGDIRRLTESSIDRVRSMTKQLCPPVLESAGLEAALKWLARQIENDYDLQIAFFDDHDNKPVPWEFQLELYNSVRELLINIAKHAGTATVCLSIGREADRLVIKVEDDGFGFDVDTVQGNPAIDGFGLYTINHRITHMNGSFKIQSSPGSGTQITIKIPLEAHVMQKEDS